MSIKEYYGGETDFTKALSEDDGLRDQLFKSCGMKINKTLYSTAETTTSTGRRADNLWFDVSTDKCIVMAESQKGRSNFDHVKKTFDYAAHTGSKYNILICEDTTPEAEELFNEQNDKEFYYLVVVTFMRDGNPIFKLKAKSSNAVFKGNKSKSKNIKRTTNKIGHGDGINHASLPLANSILKLLHGDDDAEDAILTSIYRNHLADRKANAEISTPEDFAKDMVDMLPDSVFESQDTTFCDPACGTGTFLLAIMDKLREFGHSERNISRRVFGIDIVVENAILTTLRTGLKDRNILAANSIDTVEDHEMKFDVVIGNPPYKGNMHLDFLNKSVEELSKDDGKVLFVHPAGWLLSNKPTKQVKSVTRAISHVESYLSTLDLFNGNGVFGIRMKAPLSITYLDKSEGSTDTLVAMDCFSGDESFSVDTVSEISVYGERFETSEGIKSKVILDKNLKSEQKDKYSTYLKIPMISGDEGSGKTMYTDNFYQIVGKTLKVEDRVINEGGLNNVGCNSRSEAFNMFNYIKTKFARFCLSLYKTNSNNHRGELSAVPYLDFSKSWSDTELYSHFSLTDEEIDLIETFIPNLYPEDFE